MSMFEDKLTHKDTIFNRDNIKSGSFSFNREIVDVFDDMITRSVPFFADIQQMIVNFCNFYVKDNTTIYDFGCSTGLTLFKLIQSVKYRCHFIGLDNSEAMLDIVKKRAVLLNLQDYLELKNVDLNSFRDFEKASFGVFNLVLQFLTYDDRKSLLKSFNQSLSSGGAIVIVEKIIFSDPDLNQHCIDQFRLFKQRQGYSTKEILMKEKSLQGVLRPLTIHQNKEMLLDAGFELKETFFQWYNFVGILAIKR